MAAAGAVERGPEAEARRPPSLRASRLLLLLTAVAAVGPREGGAARLYRVGVDAVWLLDSGSVRSATGNSSAAWLVQFHSSWCGHCIGYAPTWRALAADVRVKWSCLERVAGCQEEEPETDFRSGERADWQEQVILDLISYENIVVSRALDRDKAFLGTLGISSVPSCYLIYPNGSHGLVNVAKLYSADLESGLHYLLRVELAAHKSLTGTQLKTFKDFMTVVAKACIIDGLLPSSGFEDDPQAVLQTIRRYIHTFFGCKECGEHFEEMAKESMNSVKTPDQAVLWLWRKHNMVNSRLAGHLSEDPKFPKVPWPTPDLCPACHEEIKGLDSWNEDQVLVFLKQHYSRGNLVDTYSVDQGRPGDREQEEGEGLNPSGKPWGRQDAESLRPPHMLGPRIDLSKSLHHRLDLKLQSPQGLQALEEAKAAVPFLGVGFSSLDMSLCVVLYVASSLFLMIMYFFFRVRSKRWKVRLYHPVV
ncbi:Sulfhydryl oxidase 2 [Microtus ochrogaster]|uniref:Sulfhydryl oxidase n=1 Tax=Microtus ochrogaster TaxID=79684 RepID=A0A8J6KP89_MICOH|nr:Sulfhydryl oxidase 2 [Microtus ochrogaster]